jgi:hypothetical protein
MGLYESLFASEPLFNHIVPALLICRCCESTQSGGRPPRYIYEKEPA